MSEVTNRVALVTGGSRGVGRAIALALAEAGAVVAVIHRERSKDAAGVVEAVLGLGGRAEAFGCDVSMYSSVKSMVGAVEARLGPVSILVNNAGIAASRDKAITEEEFDRVMAVNLKSAFLCTEAVLPTMRAQRWGPLSTSPPWVLAPDPATLSTGPPKPGWRD